MQERGGGRDAHPVGRVLAPSCCPGASTCSTAKCLLISFMSSWLIMALKHVLSKRHRKKKITRVNK